MTISFKHFLMTEAGNFQRQALNPDQFMNILKQQCQGWINAVKSKHVIPIWRGDSNHKGALSMGDSNSFTRSAANTASWYMIWIDGSEKWEDFPKRSKAYICTNDSATAEGYGEIQVVIPYDTAHIGVVPADDMWFGFRNQLFRFFGSREIETVESFQDYVRSCAKLVNHPISGTNITQLHSDLSDITLERMQSVINNVKTAVNSFEPGMFEKLFGRNISFSSIMDTIKTGSDYKQLDKIIRDAWPGEHPSPITNFWSDYQSSQVIMTAMRKNNLDSLAQVFDVIFTPDSFTYMKGADINRLSNDEQREYWVQGPCLFIACDDTDGATISDLYKRMFKELEINMHKLTGY